MGLMRALTLKRASAIPTRTISSAKGRPQISLPTELISTTNNLSYTAPSVESMQKAAADLSAAALADTSDAVSQYEQTEPQTPTTPTSASYSRRSSHQSTGSEPSLTDASSVSSLSSPNSPEPHNLFANRTSYFSMDTLAKSSNASAASLVEDSIDPLTSIAPALPRRAPSHSKHEHERLARRRSQRASYLHAQSNSLLSLASLDAVNASSDDVFSPAPSAMPGLVEVDEEPSAEERGVAQVQSKKHETVELAQESVLVEDEDSRIMRELGLKKWSVSGYLDVVSDPWSSDIAMLDEVATFA